MHLLWHGMLLLSFTQLLPAQQNVIVRTPPTGRGFMAVNNGGMWSWGNEILVMYIEGRHVNGTACSSHSTKEGESGVNYVTSRSLDGGVTWGDHRTAFPLYTNATGNPNPQPVALATGINFQDPDTIINFQRNDAGRTNFYYSTDRGVTWDGPYNNIPAYLSGSYGRTNYEVTGPSSLKAYIQVRTTNTSTCYREDSYALTTNDGGVTWTWGTKISSLPACGSGKTFEWDTHPSVARIDANTLIASFRSGSQNAAADRTGWFDVNRSTDNGATWSHLIRLGESPGNNSCPTSTVIVTKPGGGKRVVTIMWQRPPDNNACLPARLFARLSDDNGTTWSDEITLRNDPYGWDTGYPIATVRTDGQVVICYWMKTVNQDERNYVACTIWDAASAVIVPDQTVNFTATADTYVNSQAATSNFGTADRINVHQSTTRQMESYLRFNLTNFNGRKVTTAKVRVKEHPSASAASNNSAISVQPITGAWTETGTSWNTRPALNTTTLGTVAANSIINDQLVEIPLTASHFTTTGNYNLALVGTSTGNDVGFKSREQSADKPQLQVRLSSAPTTPSGLSATATSSSQVNLTWKDNSRNENGFRLERRLGTAGTWSLVVNTAANAVSYSNTGLTAGTTYNFRIRSYNGAGVSSWSNIVSVTTQSGGGLAAPASQAPRSSDKSTRTFGIAPTDLKALLTGENSVSLAWSHRSPKGVSFEILHSEGAGFTSMGMIAGTSAEIVGLGTGLEHRFRVRSVSRQGGSGLSNEATVLTSLSYAEWSRRTFGEGVILLPLADPDGSKVSNLLRYGLGQRAHETVSELMVPAAQNGFSGIYFSKSKVAAGVNVEPQVTWDGLTWLSGAAHMEVTELMDDGDRIWMQAQSNVSDSQGGRSQWRLIATAGSVTVVSDDFDVDSSSRYSSEGAGLSWSANSGDQGAVVANGRGAWVTRSSIGSIGDSLAATGSAGFTVSTRFKLALPAGAAVSTSVAAVGLTTNPTLFTGTGVAAVRAELIFDVASQGLQLLVHHSSGSLLLGRVEAGAVRDGEWYQLQATWLRSGPGVELYAGVQALGADGAANPVVLHSAALTGESSLDQGALGGDDTASVYAAFSAATKRAHPVSPSTGAATVERFMVSQGRANH
jgi:hypothetical protein